MEELTNALNAVKLKDNEEISDVLVNIEVDGETVECSKQLLVNEFKYFRALFDFEKDRKNVELFGGISATTLKTLIKIADKKCVDEQDCSLDDLFDLFHGSAFLQSSTIDKILTDILAPQIGVSNCFQVLVLAVDTGSEDLVRASEAFILDKIETFTFRPESAYSLLGLDFEELNRIIRKELIDNSMGFALILAWTKHDYSHRSKFLEELLTSVAIEYVDVHAFSREEPFFKSCQDIYENCSKTVDHYNGLSLKEKIQYWKRNKMSRIGNHKIWPKCPIISSTGNSQMNILCYVGGKWIKLTTKPQRLKAHSSGSSMCCVNGNMLYFIGGEGNLDIWTYDITVDSWKLLSKSLFEERIRPTVIVSQKDNNIYVFGGYSSVRCNLALSELRMFTDNGLRFDTKKCDFEPLSQMSVSRCGASAVEYNGDILLFGGLCTRRQVATRCEAYNITTDTYKYLTDLPTMVIDFGMCLVDSKVFLVGGMDPFTLECKDEVMVFNIETKTWDLDFPRLNVARRCCSCFFDGRDLIVIGGNSAYSMVDFISYERYCFRSKSWILIEKDAPKSLSGSMQGVVVDMPIRLTGDYLHLGNSNVRVRNC